MINKEVYGFGTIIKPGINFSDVVVIEGESGQGAYVIELGAGTDECGFAYEPITLNREQTEALFACETPMQLKSYLRSMES